MVHEREAWQGLPGADRVVRGLDTLSARPLGCDALAVLSAAPRLRRLGLVIDAVLPPGASPELQLYHLLEAEFGDAAHGRYNAIRREIDSFADAADCAGGLGSRSSPEG